MSGQSNVEDNTVAAAANATAPTRNSPPVVRRRPVLATTDVNVISTLLDAVQYLDVVQIMYGVQRKSRGGTDRW
jgi:hypothetical protein